MVTLKVRKMGNSLGLVLPKDVVGRLRAREGQELYLLEAPNNTYLLTPVDPVLHKNVQKAEELMARSRNALHS